MNTLDIIIVVCLGYGLIRGLIRGFILEIAGVIALFIGSFGAFIFTFSFADFLKHYIELNPKIIHGISFLLLFAGIVYGISLLAKMITKTLQIAYLGLFNRFAGGLFGFIKWSVILSAIILVFNQIESVISLIPQAYIGESVAYPFIVDLGTFLFDWISESNSLFEEKLI